MTENLILTGVIILLTWSACDLYEFSIYCSRLRKLARRWRDSPSPVQSFIGKGLTCRYCLSHWVAAGWFVLLWLLPTPWVVIPLLLVAARVAVMIGENVLPPITEIPETKSQGNIQVANGYVAYMTEPDDCGTWSRNMEGPVCSDPQEAIDWATGYLMEQVHEGTGTTVEQEFLQTVRARMGEEYAKGIRNFKPEEYLELEEDHLELQIVIDTVVLSGKLIRRIQNDNTLS